MFDFLIALGAALIALSGLLLLSFIVGYLITWNKAHMAISLRVCYGLGVNSIAILTLAALHLFNTIILANTTK